jgi:hypothetical protein
MEIQIAIGERMNLMPGIKRSENTDFVIPGCGRWYTRNNGFTIDYWAFDYFLDATGLKKILPKPVPFLQLKALVLPHVASEVAPVRSRFYCYLPLTEEIAQAFSKGFQLYQNKHPLSEPAFCSCFKRLSSQCYCPIKITEQTIFLGYLNWFQHWGKWAREKIAAPYIYCQETFE